MAKSHQNAPAGQEVIQVRYEFPKDVHKKIRSHKRTLSAEADRDVDMEEALIDFIRKAKI